MTIRRLIFLILLAALALPGCSLLNPGPPPARVRLSPQNPPASALPVMSRQLVVETPTAGRELDTDGIALVFDAREVRYLAGHRWTEAAPALVRRALVEAMNANHSLRAVADEGARLNADARLVSDLQRFYLRYDDETRPPTAEVALNFLLVNPRNGAVMAANMISAERTAAGRDPASLVKAVEAALSDVLGKAAPWIESVLREREGRGT